MFLSHYRTTRSGFRIAVVLLVLLAGSALADPPDPRFGTRTVDGDVGDWNLSVDWFADMHRAGKLNKPLESKAYLRYSCKTLTLYVLVLAEPGIPVAATPPELAWVAIDGQANKVVNGNSGNGGSPPNFAWVGRPAAPGDSLAAGYEASFALMPGSYEIIVHCDVLDAGAQQTSATVGFPGSGPSLVLSCMVPVEQGTWGRIKSVYR